MDYVLKYFYQDGSEVPTEIVQYYVRNGRIEDLEEFCRTGISKDLNAPADMNRVFHGIIQNKHQIPTMLKDGVIPEFSLVPTYPGNGISNDRRNSVSNLFCNFIIRIKHIILHHGDMEFDGIISKKTYLAEIVVRDWSLDTPSYTIEASIEELLKIRNYTSWTSGRAIYVGKTAEIDQRLRQHISHEINSATLIVEHRFPYCGYVKGNNKLYYATANAMPINGNEILRSADDMNLNETDYCLDLEKIMSAEYIFRDRNTGKIMLLTLLVGLLIPVMDAMGIQPKFVLAIIGPTGCRKTAVAKTFFSIFNRDFNNSPLDVEATFLMDVVELENRLYKSGTPVKLVDDYRPLAESTARKQQLSKLEKILRIFGDRIRNRKGEHPNGVGAITAEFVDPEIHESSILRMIILELSIDSIDNEVLWEYQKMPLLFPAFVKSFTDFVCTMYNDLVESARCVIECKRMEYGHIFKHSRYAEYAAQLDFAVECFVKYLSSHNVKDTDSVENQYKQALLNILNKNETMICEDTVIEQALRALREDLETHHAEYVDVPVEGKLSKETERINSSDKVYIKSKATQEILMDRGIEFNKNLKMSLADMKIMKSFKEGSVCRFDTRLKFVDGQCRYNVFDKNLLLG